MTHADHTSSQPFHSLSIDDRVRLHRLARKQAHALRAQAGKEAWAAARAAAVYGWRVFQRVLSAVRVSSTHREV
jgi:hypothetical protein